MACHEIAALRIGLMNVLGIDDPAEKAHELAEIGDSAQKNGPIKALLNGKTLEQLQRDYENSLAHLEEKVAKTSLDDPKLGYYRTLLVFTKKVELELRSHVTSLNTFYRDLEEMHDFIHEIYPS